MLLTLKEDEIRLAITAYVASVLGSDPHNIDPASISLTAGRGVNGMTAEIDVQLLKSGIAAAPVETPKAIVPKPNVTTPVVKESSQEEDTPPFTDDVLEPEESLPEADSEEQEEEETSESEPEPEEEPAPTPRRRGPLFGGKAK